MDRKPAGAGKSSFELIDADKLFRELRLKEDSVFLDLACGRGAYSIAAAQYVGRTGAIYAFDLWREGIDALRKQIEKSAASYIHTEVVDIGARIPLEDHSVDVCLLATVLHDLIQDATDRGALREIKRVVKPGGTLAVIEFKKVEGPPGPPVTIRLSPEEVERHLRSYSFRITRTTDIGDFNFLSLFVNSVGTFSR